MGLARKILLTLFFASIGTAGLVYFIYNNEDLNEFVSGDRGMKVLFFALLLAFITLATLACFKGKIY